MVGPLQLADQKDAGAPSADHGELAQEGEMKVDYTCHNEECEHEFKVAYSPAIRPSGFAGCREDYDPGEDAEIRPGECPKCGTEVDFEEVHEESEPDQEYYMEDDIY